MRTLLAFLFSVVLGLSGSVHASTWISPISAIADGETNWGGTWYTGPASYAIDGNLITKWTYNNLGAITFDLGAEYLIEGVEVYWNGSVSNGNTVNIFVEGVQVVNEEQFGAFSNIRYFVPIQGRYITYETLPLPHNELLQVATWSEINEFRVFAQPVPVPPALLLFGSGLVSLVGLGYMKLRSNKSIHPSGYTGV